MSRCFTLASLRRLAVFGAVVLLPACHDFGSGQGVSPCISVASHCAGDRVVDDCGEVAATCTADQTCHDGTILQVATCVPRCGNGALDDGETCDAEMDDLGDPYPISEGCDPSRCQVAVPTTCGNSVDDPGELCFRNAPQPDGFFASPDALADLDGDGDLDLLDGEQFHVNDGTGRFASVKRIPWPAKTGAVLPPFAGDVDRDGRVDLLRIAGTELQIVLRRAGGDTANVVPLGHVGTVFAVADLDGDGHPDVVVGGPSGLGFLPGDGAGGLGAERPLGPQAGWSVVLAVADFDGVNGPDLVIAPLGLFGGLGPPRLLLSQGGGGFNEVPLPIDASSVAALDIDGDGHIDLAVVTGSMFDSTAALVILHNDGTAQFTVAQTIPEAVGTDVRAADVDGDGRADLLVFGGDGAVYKNLGGSFAPAVYFEGFGSRHAIGDLDGDGRADIIELGAPRGTTVLLAGDVPSLALR